MKDGTREATFDLNVRSLVPMQEHLEIVRNLEDEVVILKEVIAEMAIERIMGR